MKAPNESPNQPFVAVPVAAPSAPPMAVTVEPEFAAVGAQPTQVQPYEAQPVVAQPIQSPATNEIMVAMPANARPGNTIRVNVNGTQHDIVVPPGAVPGSHIKVSIPAAPAPALVQTQQVMVTVPMGAQPGSTIQIVHEGVARQVVLPPGATPGATISVALNAPSVATQSTTVVQQRYVRTPPHGALEGGRWVTEQYCGIVTCLIAIFIAPCVCCCPCDTRSTYIDPTGQKYPETPSICPCCECNGN